MLQTFGNGSPVIDGSTDTLGGKGARLVEMSDLGIPVPPGVIVPTTSMGDTSVISGIVPALETVVQPELTLFSARSGAKFSMPGMMDTILNLGMTDENLESWAKIMGKRAAYDSYRRLLEMFGTTVYGIDKSKFDAVVGKYKQFRYGKAQPPATDADVTAKCWWTVIYQFKLIYKRHGVSLPTTLEGQIEGAVKAVWNSWHGNRAVAYRRDHGISDDLGTAVTIQKMVFGNLNNKSGSGVYFTRNPATGSIAPMGEFLVNAQGEDVVAGVRTPQPYSAMMNWDDIAHAKLFAYGDELEKHYGDMQDIEFTVENGKLWILQSRNGKRTPRAAFKIAFDMMTENGSPPVGKVTYDQYRQIQGVKVAEGFDAAPTFEGLGAGGSVVTGYVVKSVDEAIAESSDGKSVILVTEETTPDDYEGMTASVGILTATGGMTCHAAVVARSMNKTCVVGAGSGVCTLDSGTSITIDGASGRIWVGTEVPIEDAGQDESVVAVMSALLNDQSLTDGVHIKARPAEAMELIEKHGKHLQFDVQIIDGTDLEVLADAKWKVRGFARAEKPFAGEEHLAKFVGLQPDLIKGYLSERVREVITGDGLLKSVGEPTTIRQLIGCKGFVDLVNLPHLSSDDVAALRELVGPDAFKSPADSVDFDGFLKKVMGG